MYEYFASSLKIPLLTVLLILGEAKCSATDNDGNTSCPAVSAVERCRRQHQVEKLSTLEGTVGMGWDNLRNVPMAAVLSSTFLQCGTTPDRLYLISDNMEVLPVKRSQLDRTANFYEYYHDYFASQAESINLQAGLSFEDFGISGSFSYQHQDTRHQFVQEKSSLFRTSLLYHAYTVTSQPGTMLHPTFKARLLEINDAVSKNLTRMARYLAQTTIRDFGTHLITQADVGAIISQDDFVDSNVDFSQRSSLDEVKAEAATSLFTFLKLPSISGRIAANQTTKEQYSKMLRHSQIQTRGGPDVNRLLSATAGDTSTTSQATMMVDDLVSLDRSGVPLFTVINGDNLLELPQPNVQLIRYLIMNATEEYYLRNTRRGCMDPGAENFDFQANVNDSTCGETQNNFTFGGVFQTCEAVPEANTTFRPSAGARCDGLTQPNGATGSASCQEHYEPVNIFAGVYQFPDRHEQYCIKECKTCYLFWTCCEHPCFDIVYQDRVALKAYWCNAKATEVIPADQGFLFGGLFSKGQANPFTRNPGCPGHFQSYHLGWDLIVCLSRDYQLDKPYSIKFGGFFSCQTPSAHAKCPKGYSQHLAMVVDSCEVYYCARPEAFINSKSAIVVRPPYEDLSSLISNETGSVIYGFLDNNLWFKLPIQDALQDMILKIDSSPDKHPLLLSQPNGMSEEEALHEWVKNLDIPANKKNLNTPATTEKAKLASAAWQPIENKSSSGLGTLPIIGIVIVAIISVVVIAGILIRKWRNSREPGPGQGLDYEPI